MVRVVVVRVGVRALRLWGDRVGRKRQLLRLGENRARKLRAELRLAEGRGGSLAWLDEAGRGGQKDEMRGVDQSLRR